MTSYTRPEEGQNNREANNGEETHQEQTRTISPTVGIDPTSESTDEELPTLIPINETNSSNKAAEPISDFEDDRIPDEDEETGHNPETSSNQPAATACAEGRKGRGDIPLGPCSKKRIAKPAKLPTRQREPIKALAVPVRQDGISGWKSYRHPSQNLNMIQMGKPPISGDADQNEIWP